MSKSHLKVVKESETPFRKNVRYEMVSVDNIKPNPFQPRVIFDEAELDRLAETIRANGEVDEDVVLAQHVDGRFIDGAYTLINGERRVRATKLAKITHVPAKILESVSRRELLERACRSDFCKVPLNLIERAFAIKTMMEENGWKQGDVAKYIGKHVSMVSTTLRIFKLTEELQSLAVTGKIPPDVALELSRWEESAQKILLSACNEEILRNGKPFSQQGLLLFVRGKAEKLGFKKCQGGKKTRKNLSLCTLLTRSITRSAEKLSKEIVRLSEDPTELKSMRDPTLMDLIGCLEGLRKIVSEKIEILEAIQD